MIFYDLHSHKPSQQAEDVTIISVDLREQYILSEDMAKSGHVGYYSAGVHPWYIDKNRLPVLRKLAALPSVVAIGETGLDKNRGDYLLQLDFFEEHILLSEKVTKPLIIHCVKAWDDLLRIQKALKPTQPWIIHGFRGNENLATQMLNTGMYLSFGIHHNIASLKAAWDKKRLFIETDDTDINIRDVYALIANNLNITINELLDEAKDLFKKFSFI